MIIRSNQKAVSDHANENLQLPGLTQSTFARPVSLDYEIEFGDEVDVLIIFVFELAH